MIVNNFSDGYRCMDNVCTNFTKFGEDDRLYTYNDIRPQKTVYIY